MVLSPLRKQRRIFLFRHEELVKTDILPQIFKKYSQKICLHIEPKFVYYWWVDIHQNLDKEGEIM